MRILTCAIFLLLAGCSAAGGLRPTIMTNPISYLQTFPLGTSESVIETQIGPPDKVTEIAGKKALVYKMGEDYGVRTYSYIISDGKVIDVIYNDNGPDNGSTADKLQSNSNK